MSTHYRRRNSRPTSRRSRWMDLRYAGHCHICAAPVNAGARAYYDAQRRTVTCWEMACCEADGLTRQEWAGSPTSGRWVTVRAESRIGAGYVTETYDGPNGIERRTEYVRDPGEDMADRWNESHS